MLNMIQHLIYNLNPYISCKGFLFILYQTFYMKPQHRLINYINEIESYIPKHESKNLVVSKSTVGWQIDHSLKVINGIIAALKDAPTDKTSKLTLLGHFCLTTRYIPRGKGKAPKRVLPPDHIEEKQLYKQLTSAKFLVPKIQSIDSKATFKHPYFGVLSKKQTIRFIEVHTNHHLKIIRDILK